VSTRFVVRYIRPTVYEAFVRSGRENFDFSTFVLFPSYTARNYFYCRIAYATIQYVPNRGLFASVSNICFVLTDISVIRLFGSVCLRRNF